MFNKSTILTTLAFSMFSQTAYSGFQQNAASFITSNKSDMEKGNVEGIKNSLKSNLVNGVANSYLNDTLRPYRIEVDLGYSSVDDTIMPNVLTIQPLKTSKDNTNMLFFQGRLMTDYSKQRNSNNTPSTETTTNMGVGYRHLLLNKKAMVGINSFFDRNWSWEHNRLGYGAEAKYANFDLYANYYNAISNEKIKGDITQRALSGYDMELVTALPYLPWFQVGYKTYVWNSKFMPEDIKGNKYTLFITPMPSLIIEASFSKGNSAGYQIISEKQILIRYQLALGAKNKEKHHSFHKLVDSQAFRTRDMTNNLTDIVRREDRIITENKDKKSGMINIIRVN